MNMRAEWNLMTPLCRFYTRHATEYGVVPGL
jgi:hypothetical protein